MKIHFEISGGLAGKARIADKEEGKNLSENDVLEVRKLISQADFFNASPPELGAMPDSHIAMIFIEDSGQSRQMVLSPENAPKKLKNFVNCLEGILSPEYQK